MVGGLMPIPEDARKAGVGPTWMGYIGVNDVDAYAKRVKTAGGAIRREPSDIPGIGRFAVAADPHGAKHHVAVITIGAVAAFGLLSGGITASIGKVTALLP